MWKGGIGRGEHRGGDGENKGKMERKEERGGMRSRGRRVRCDLCVCDMRTSGVYPEIHGGDVRHVEAPGGGGREMSK